MKIMALLFASFRETAGHKELELEVPRGSTVRAVAQVLERQCSGLQLSGALCAVNHDYAKPDAPVAEGDTVAFLPPVSGG